MLIYCLWSFDHANATPGDVGPSNDQDGDIDQVDLRDVPHGYRAE